MSRNHLFWGIVLLIVGGLFLLQNMGLLAVNVWNLIWPIFLILLGAWFLFSITTRREVYLTEQLSIPQGLSKTADVFIRHGAGRLTISGGAPAGSLASGSCMGGVVRDLRQEGSNTRLRLSPPTQHFFDIPWFIGPRTGFTWQIALTEDIPLTLKIETGASESQMDLSKLKVTDLRIRTGASDTRLILPENAGRIHASIHCGAASIRVQVPSGVAARIRAQTGLSELRVDKSRFNRTDGGYETPDFNSAINAIDLFIEAGVGSVEVS